MRMDGWVGNVTNDFEQWQGRQSNFDSGRSYMCLARKKNRLSWLDWVHSEGSWHGVQVLICGLGLGLVYFVSICPSLDFSTLAMRLQMHSLEHRVRRIRMVKTCIVLTLLLFLFCILNVLYFFIFPHCFPCFIVSPSSSCDTFPHRGTCRSCGLWITPWMLGLGGWCWQMGFRMTEWMMTEWGSRWRSLFSLEFQCSTFFCRFS